MATQSDKQLLYRLVGWSVVGQVGLAACLFVPGTMDYWQGWAFVAVNAVVGVIFCIHLYRHNRDLLVRRMLRKEKFTTQKIVLFLLKNVSVLAYVLCALDHRFGWSRTYLFPVPWWLTVLALFLYATCYFLFIPVFNANRFAASVIQTENDQTVADHGPYRWVRHPMYAVMLAVWVWVPLALGSFIALPVVALMIPTLVLRLLHEEKVLRRDLPGYADYCQKTRYRLVPRVW